MPHVLEGVYFDPYHGGCLRSIEQTAPSRFVIHGVYGDDELDTSEYWFAEIHLLPRPKKRSKTQSKTIRMEVDFSGKPQHPGITRATYQSRRIHWDDGNQWVKMYVHARQLPIDIIDG